MGAGGALFQSFSSVFLSGGLDSAPIFRSRGDLDSALESLQHGDLYLKALIQNSLVQSWLFSFLVHCQMRRSATVSGQEEALVQYLNQFKMQAYIQCLIWYWRKT